MSQPAYVIGHEPEEVRRLELQAGFLRPLTEQLLLACGLAPGMRVLDIGTGAGDVAMLAAAVVGPGGAVLGIDRSAAVLGRARARAAAAGLAQVRFEQADLSSGEGLGTFDLVVGRYVLFHQADKVGFLREAAPLVRSGGRLALFEMGSFTEDNFSAPAVALYDEVMHEVLDAFALAGVDHTVGARLAELFAAAGLPEPHLLSGTPVGGPGTAIADWIFGSWKTIQSAFAEAGRVSRFDGARLLDDLRVAARTSRAQFFGPRNVVAWATLG